LLKLRVQIQEVGTPHATMPTEWSCLNRVRRLMRASVSNCALVERLTNVGSLSFSQCTLIFISMMIIDMISSYDMGMLHKVVRNAQLLTPSPRIPSRW
jgi:hypothetical protein